MIAHFSIKVHKAMLQALINTLTEMYTHELEAKKGIYNSLIDFIYHKMCS